MSGCSTIQARGQGGVNTIALLHCDQAIVHSHRNRIGPLLKCFESRLSFMLSIPGWYWRPRSLFLLEVQTSVDNIFSRSFQVPSADESSNHSDYIPTGLEERCSDFPAALNYQRQDPEISSCETRGSAVRAQRLSPERTAYTDNGIMMLGRFAKPITA